MKSAALLVAAFLAVPAAQASIVVFSAELSGLAEAPANASPATGFTQMTYDSSTHLLQINVNFTGLTGNTTASHIHCCTAVPGTGTAGVVTQVPTFDFIPLGIAGGSFSGVKDLLAAASYNPAFLTARGNDLVAAEAFFLAGLQSGQAYLNIHTNAFPGGEIRGFLTVPEPSSLALASLAALGLWGVAGRRRRSAAA